MSSKEEGGSDRRMGTIWDFHTPRVGYWTKASSPGKGGPLPSPGPRSPEQTLPSHPTQPRPALLGGAAGGWWGLWGVGGTWH